MGHCHNYAFAPAFDAAAFKRVAADFYRMQGKLKHLGVVLAGWLGTGNPIITPTHIRFNGPRNCGHEERQLGITFPADGARGVAKNGVGTQNEDIAAGWHPFGRMLKTRACGGDCSHEPFELMQTYAPHAYPRGMERPIGEFHECAKMRGKYGNSCKTAFKPYDLAVQVCLVIARHYLGDGIIIESDGSRRNWDEAVQLCQHFLGYGDDFRLYE